MGPRGPWIHLRRLKWINKQAMVNKWRTSKDPKRERDKLLWTRSRTANVACEDAFIRRDKKRRECLNIKTIEHEKFEQKSSNPKRSNIKRSNIARFNIKRLNIARFNIRESNIRKFSKKRLNIRRKKHEKGNHKKVEFLILFKSDPLMFFKNKNELSVKVFSAF